jgi:hypothetical protein
MNDDRLDENFTVRFIICWRKDATCRFEQIGHVEYNRPGAIWGEDAFRGALDQYGRETMLKDGHYLVMYSGEKGFEAKTYRVDFQPVLKEI